MNCCLKANSRDSSPPRDQKKKKEKKAIYKLEINKSVQGEEEKEINISARGYFVSFTSTCTIQ